MDFRQNQYKKWLEPIIPRNQLKVMYMVQNVTADLLVSVSTLLDL
jgi:hypothetical protein